MNNNGVNPHPSQVPQAAWPKGSSLPVEEQLFLVEEATIAARAAVEIEARKAARDAVADVLKAQPVPPPRTLPRAVRVAGLVTAGAILFGSGFFARGLTEKHYTPRLKDAATAMCSDGTASYAMNYTGACSGHGGVKEWYRRPRS